MPAPPHRLWLQDIERGAGALGAVVGVDPRLAYLDHHRPDGEPLFGTVMGIEAMARAAGLLAGEPTVASIECVEIHAPYLPARRAGVLRVRAERGSQGAAGAMSCTRFSVAEGGECLHFRGRVRIGAIAAAGTGAHRRRATAMVTYSISAADIYRVYFHGPAYRVLAGAGWCDGRLYACAAERLPGLFGDADPGDGDQPVVAAPRAIEFALQSAGLHALAIDGTLRIPERIGAIRWLAPVRDTGSLAATSIVHPRTDGLLDVTIYDEHGRPTLQVVAYATVPLPYALDTDAVGQLRRRLMPHPG